MLPAIFRSSRALPGLSVLSVGLAMSAATGLVFGKVLGSGSDFSGAALITGLPTLAVGTAWAALLRWRRTVGRRQIRLGWLLSVPLAALNGALVGGLMLNGKGLEVNALGFVLGATMGSFVWLPAMLVVLLVFGVPIAWSQRQARRGLDGAERGEVAVGLVCLQLSIVSLIALLVSHETIWLPPVVDGRGEALTLPVVRAGQPGSIFLAVVSALGLLTGGATTALATARGRQRRRLIDATEAGQRPDYRVERTPAGRVLIRVRPASADDYRQADADEEAFALDEALAEASALSSRSAGVSG